MNGGLLSLISFYMSFKVTPNRILSCLEGTSAASRRNLEFVTPEAFPQAEGLLCGPFTELARHITVTPEDYVVIMTRGHQADYEVLMQVLRSGAKYLGCVGSRRKLALCKERLLAAGFTETEYARLHAPIGLAIGAQTPSEIAVSVAAELIAVRAGVQP